jgi:hypothetical protein
MASGILLVESTPRSVEHLAAFHHWYDQVHIPQMLEVDGFVSAQRFAGSDDDTFLAIYEIDGDLDVAKAAVAARHADGRMTPPVGVQLKPPPTARYFTKFPSSATNLV